MCRQQSAKSQPASALTRETLRYGLDASRAVRVGQIISQVYRASISRFPMSRGNVGMRNAIAAGRGHERVGVRMEKNARSERARHKREIQEPSAAGS